MRHGFKARAERFSIQAREMMHLKPLDPLDPWLYAKYLKVILIDFKSLDIASKTSLHLLKSDPESWSGLTIKKNGVTAILINPSHSKNRQASTLTHELAHISLKHAPASVSLSNTGLLLLSDYSADSEEEADWLAGALLLPRDMLLNQRRKGSTVAQIAAKYGVSEKFCDWRLRMTGVEIQLKRGQL